MKVSNLDICFAPTPIHMYIHIPCIKNVLFVIISLSRVPYDGVPDEYISALIKSYNYMWEKTLFCAHFI